MKDPALYIKEDGLVDRNPDAEDLRLEASDYKRMRGMSMASKGFSKSEANLRLKFNALMQGQLPTEKGVERAFGVHAEKRQGGVLSALGRLAGKGKNRE